MYNPYFYRPIINNRMIPPISGRYGLNLYPRFTQRINPTPIIKNFSNIIDTTQKGINTINQIIPIYKEVKPIAVQFKNWGKSITSFFNKTPTRNANSYNNTTNQTNYYKNNQRSSQSNDFYDFTTPKPSSPFYK